MHRRSWLRDIWSRQTLAAKLTLSYSTALMLIGLAVAVIAALAVITQLRSAAADAATRAAAEASMIVRNTLEEYHERDLLSQLEMVVHIITRCNPDNDRDLAVASIDEQNATSDGFFYIIGADGSIEYFPPGYSGLPDDDTRQAARRIAETGTGFFRYSAAATTGDGKQVYQTYALALPEWGWTVVVADAQDGILQRMPINQLSDALDVLIPGTGASALYGEESRPLAFSSTWKAAAGDQQEPVSLVEPAVHPIANAFGRQLRLVASAPIPEFHAAIAMVYDADYLEALIGRAVILLAAAAIASFLAVTIISHQTARFVTAPVRRATEHLIGATSPAPSVVEPTDELAGLVRHLLRTSVKLAYERKHRTQAEDELEITATVYRNIGEGIALLDLDGVMLRVNPAFQSITGYESEELLGRNPGFLVTSDMAGEYGRAIWKELQTRGEWVGELAIVRKSGEPVPILVSARKVTGGGHANRHFIFVVRDISDIKSTQSRLEHLASHDPLTGLTNRIYLSESLDRIVRSRNPSGKAAVIFIDVDHFKDVNDAHGHHVGDELLQTVAKRLKATIRGEDLISRFGGDEFVVVLTDFADASRVDEAVRRMLNGLREPVVIGGITLRPSATAGIAIYPESGTTPEDLMRNADAAMYEAKRIGRGSYRFHDPEINESVRVRLAVQDSVRFALRTGEFVLLWQPVVRVSDGRIVGAEALIRRRVGESFEAPVKFLPQIEGSRVIVELANWVLRNTAGSLSVHETVLPEGFRVAVNVSATEFLQRDFVPMVLDALGEQSVANRRLAVELTEGTAVRDVPTAQAVIRRLRGEDINVYLDDFGVGYSSLQYLRELGVSAVKLDKSFLDDVPHSSASCSLVRGVVEITHGLGLRTTVEGVERPEQLEYLQTIGCDFVQGFHTGKPMSVRDFVLQLAKQRAGNGNDPAPKSLDEVSSLEGANE